MPWLLHNILLFSSFCIFYLLSWLTGHVPLAITNSSDSQSFATTCKTILLDLSVKISLSFLWPNLTEWWAWFWFVLWVQCKKCNAPLPSGAPPSSAVNSAVSNIFPSEEYSFSCSLLMQLTCHVLVGLLFFYTIVGIILSLWWYWKFQGFLSFIP